MNGPHFELMQTEEQRVRIFEIMKSCNLLKYNLHAWDNPALSNWLELTQNGNCDVWHAEGWGVYYLTQGLGATPWAHFAIWPEARHEAKKFLCAAVQHGFNLYSFQAVMGLTPAKFRHVFPLLKECGFEVLGMVPESVCLYGKQADGILSIFRRQTLWA